MRTIAWETAPQLPLRNCFKEPGEKVTLYVILMKVNTCNQAHIFCRKFLLVMGSSHHHRGFQCFSRYEDVCELGS